MALHLRLHPRLCPLAASRISASAKLAASTPRLFPCSCPHHPRPQTTARGWGAAHVPCSPFRLNHQTRRFSTSRPDKRQDPRDLGRELLDEFSELKKEYAPPRNPLILAHGLLGFSQLSLLSLPLPYTYFSGISPALTAHSVVHHTTSVPPTSSISERAAALATQIASLCPDTPVNIVAHSMGGLDARYMLSCLAPSNVRVASLVTIATPHRGSIIADRVLDGLGGERGLERATRLLGRVGLEMTGVEQLTRRYMSEEFNPIVSDVEGVRYFSYGASMEPPSLMNPFRWSFDLLREEEGPNDGLVSVESSRWGTYEGTLMDVSHLDLINWSNNIAWTVKGWMGMERRFNAIAFYLGIADMLAKEGL